MASNLRVDTILPSTGTTLGIGTASGTINFLGNSNITTTGTINAASATITGNLGVGGVLTYEDVTNIDSIGIITTRSGINVSGGEVKVGTAVTVSSGGVITSGIVTATNVSVASSVTAATFHGSGANLTDISSVGGNTGVDFNDDVKARFGSSNQLEIFYGSSLGNVKVTSGNLNLISSGGVVTKVNTSEDAIVCNANSSVDLYHNGSKKFETTSSGVSVTGQLVVSSAITANSYLMGNTNSGGFLFYSDTSASKGVILDTDDHLRPTNNNVQDLGGSSYRWRNIYTNDLNLSNKGSTNSVDNTWGDYTIQEGESDLFLINNRSGKKYKFNLTEVS